MAKDNIDEDQKSLIEAEYRELYSDRISAIRSSQATAVSADKNIPLHQIDFLHDVKLKLIVEFGRSKMTLGDILSLRKNSLIMVEKSLGEPVDILAGEAPVARGEIVTVNDRLGIRITEIIRPEETAMNSDQEDDQHQVEVDSENITDSKNKN